MFVYAHFLKLNLNSTITEHMTVLKYPQSAEVTKVIETTNLKTLVIMTLGKKHCKVICIL